MRTYPISELYGPVIQGEGALAGRSSHFIRFGFCDGPGGTEPGASPWCTWCDSMFSVDPKNKQEWRQLTTEDILREVEALGHADYVTLSGGNPAIYDLTELVRLLHNIGARCALETQGTIYQPWMQNVAHLTLSPKPPSAGGRWTRKHSSTLDTILENCANGPIFRPTPDGVALKIVVDPDSKFDRDYAAGMIWTYGDPETVESFLSCLTKPDDTRDSLGERYARLCEWAVQEPLFKGKEVAVFPQLHVLSYLHKLGV